MVKADPEFEEALDVLPVGRVEAEATDRFGEGALLLLVRDLTAGESLRLFGGVSLGEVHHVDRLAIRGEQGLNGFEDRRLAIAEVEGNRAVVAVDVGDRSIGELLDPLLDRRRIAQGLSLIHI